MSLYERITEALNGPGPRSHRYPPNIPDSEVLAWKCVYCDEWVDDAGPRTTCDAAPMPEFLHVPRGLLAEAAQRLQQLEDWKTSTMNVLAEWDAVHDALGRPGKLGESKAAASAREVARLRSLLDPQETNQ